MTGRDRRNERRVGRQPAPNGGAAAPARSGPLAATLLLAAAAWAAPLGATAGPPATGVELTPTVQERLGSIQDLWLQWVSAFYQGNPERAEAVLEHIEDAVRSIGFQYLPDLSLAVLGRAVEAAESGDFERAAWGLEVAAALDPGRPELWFARARVARLDGRPLQAVRYVASGYATLFEDTATRQIWLHNAALWVLLTLFVAGAVFLLYQVAARGPALYRDLVRRLGGRLPSPVAHGLVIAGLVWPLFLPGGPVWLLVFWSVLLWARCSTSERWVFVGLWAMMTAAPALVVHQSHSLTVDQSPPLRAVAHLEKDRLYGAFFTDLGLLPTVLPDSPAVRQVVADLHLRLGQWELARAHYRDLLVLEPANTAALVNLGVHAYRDGDYATATDFFRRASSVEVPPPEAYYNLSQALSATYQFEESRNALWRAREIHDGRVTYWIRERPEDAVVQQLDGLGRVGEIRRELSRTWARRVGWEPVSATAAAAGGLVLLALVGLWWPGGPGGVRKDTEPGSRLVAVLLPGWSSVRAARGPRAYVALLPVAALGVLPLFDSSLGYRLPWGFSPGDETLWVCALAGLVLLLVGRLVVVRR